IYTNDPREVFQFRRGISAGMVSINNSTSGAEAHLPFGGNGKSGNGRRQSGILGLGQFTRWPAMNLDYSGRLPEAPKDGPERAAALGLMRSTLLSPSDAAGRTGAAVLSDCFPTARTPAGPCPSSPPARGPAGRSGRGR